MQKTSEPVVNANDITRIAGGASIKGDLSSPTDIRIDGNIDGKVYSGGLYGLCRHPGFWWLLFAYVCLGMACGSEMMRFGLFCSFLNLLYIGFQDMVIFPRIFVDYGDYKRKVPFLIPRRKHNAISR